MIKFNAETLERLKKEGKQLPFNFAILRNAEKLHLEEAKTLAPPYISIPQNHQTAEQFKKSLSSYYNTAP